MKRFGLTFFICLTSVIISIGQLPLLASNFPEHELRMIVPSAPGSSLDRMARSIERFLPDILGVRVIVENRTGAGGIIATKYFLKQKADGYTILVTLQPSMTLLTKIAPDLVSFNDINVLNINWIDPQMILVRKSLGWNSLDDMVTAVRNNPDTYKFGMPGRFSTATFAGKMLFGKLGLKVRKIPYTGTGDSRIALRGGHIDILTAGATGIISVEDIAKSMGIFWKEPVNEWPSIRPINESLKPYSIRMPNMASIRFFAVHSEVKKSHPERYQILVNAWKKLTTEHKGFKKFCNETSVGNQWYGPEKSWKLIMESDKVFSQIKLPKKKKK